MFLWLIGFTANGVSVVNGQDRLISFDRDIRPILDAKCIVCHGPDDAKNEFRVDQSESLLDYIEPGSVDDSSLWVDYLVTTDDDLRMPPLDDEQLTGAEFAAIKLWIEEGAEWEDPADVAAIETEVKPAEPASLLSKSWTFQGLFHPVSVHLPVAFLSISVVFLLLSYKFPKASFQAVAFHCLWVGALGAVAACVTGWAYASHEGYGNFSFDVVGSLVDRHRWAGILVAIVSLALLPLAVKVHLKEQQQLRKYWLMGSMLVAVMVGATGNWGGELVQGANHYFKEFKLLFLMDDADEGEAPDVQDEPAGE